MSEMCLCIWTRSVWIALMQHFIRWVLLGKSGHILWEHARVLRQSSSCLSVLVWKRTCIRQARQTDCFLTTVSNIGVPMTFNGPLSIEAGRIGRILDMPLMLTSARAAVGAHAKRCSIANLGLGTVGMCLGTCHRGAGARRRSLELSVR